MGEIRIQTLRLLLRPLRFSDAGPVADLIDDFDIVRMLSRVPWPYRAEHAEQWIDSHSRLDPDRNQPLAIEHPEHGLIGVTGFHSDEDARFPEIGYWLGRDYWGQGYASEATRAALNWAAAIWGKRAIVSGHFVDNPASGRVLTKAGFLYTGVVRSRENLARGEAVPSRLMVWLP